MLRCAQDQRQLRRFRQVKRLHWCREHALLHVRVVEHILEIGKEKCFQKTIAKEVKLRIELCKQKQKAWIWSIWSLIMINLQWKIIFKIWGIYSRKHLQAEAELHGRKHHHWRITSPQSSKRIEKARKRSTKHFGSGSNVYEAAKKRICWQSDKNFRSGSKRLKAFNEIIKDRKHLEAKNN